MSTRLQPLHPGAWWLWAAGLATAAARTTNPVLLLLILAVAGYVVAARRTSAPWARSYEFYLRMALVVIVIRVVLAALFGAPVPGRVLVRLPEAELPEWAAGVRLGGPVTLEGVAGACYAGLQLATMLACVGAANALANPRRLLKALPGALYEVGVAVVVALSFSPQLVEGVARVRAARRLRGRPHRGLRGIGGIAMPVLEGALERSVELAAAMDARGFGRATANAPRSRRVAGVLTLAGLLGLCAGAYGLLDSSSPAVLGLPLLAVSAALAVTGLHVGGRRAARTRYRPDRWAALEWVVGASGAAAALTMIATGLRDPGPLHPTTSPLTLPGVPLLAAAGILLALAPAWTAPAPEPEPAPRLREKVAA